MGAWSTGGGGSRMGTAVTPESGVVSQNLVVAEAESALIALGYKPVEAAKAVSRVASDDITRSEELIKLALRSMIPA